VERFLVTGALGCLGAWTVGQLVRADVDVVAADVGEDTHRLELVMSQPELARVVLEQSDVTDLRALGQLLDEHEITHVVPLAALQVPFCRDDPPLGAAVNVLGTVNVFEAVKRRRPRIEGLAYASSIAVYGAEDQGDEPERPRPDTHYGVYKVANEGTARIYWQDDRVPSVGLRPNTVYGPARDRGVTAAPTLAMLAAAQGEPFHIPWGGSSRYHHARDVADAFVAAARADVGGARVYNLPGEPREMREVVEAIERAAPGAAGTITFDDAPLPFPRRIESETFGDEIAALDWTPFEDGVRETIEHFRAVPAEA
jgi:nucleoside-diphosphate-sugar epimerase